MLFVVFTDGETLVGGSWLNRRSMGVEFLSLLSSDTTQFTFQTFGEGKEEHNRTLTHVLHNSLAHLFDRLTTLNDQGAGIFVTVNETDGKGRKAHNITRVRAIWQDDDYGYDGEFPVQPSLIVSTSP